jgi:hypothetical protein
LESFGVFTSNKITDSDGNQDADRDVDRVKLKRHSNVAGLNFFPCG